MLPQIKLAIARFKEIVQKRRNRIMYFIFYKSINRHQNDDLKLSTFLLKVLNKAFARPRVKEECRAILH